jgi:hypothetical protein
MNFNELETSLSEFNSAMSLFSKGRVIGKTATIAFDGKYLSIEVGGKATAMVAYGNWNGIATISSQLIRALAIAPPAMNPVKIRYAEGKIYMAGMSLTCDWENISKRYIHKLLNPSTLELLAIERTAKRSELGSSELGKKCNAALIRREKSLNSAMHYLQEFGIQKSDILKLIEVNVQKVIDRN